jgi:hypothetical protein
MSQTVRPTWIIERAVARGTVRIGVAGSRFAAELNGRPVKLASNDIASLEEIAASRFTAHMVPTLRGGGYTHLLGGQVALLPGEARTLRAVAMGTPEGLVIHRSKLLEALEKETDDGDTPIDINSGLAQHGDERALRITPARQALNSFDERHPQVRAAMAGKAE